MFYIILHDKSFNAWLHQIITLGKVYIKIKHNLKNMKTTLEFIILSSITRC